MGKEKMGKGKRRGKHARFLDLLTKIGGEDIISGLFFTTITSYKGIIKCRVAY